MAEDPTEQWPIVPDQVGSAPRHAPDWYADPQGPPGQLRWFDGNTWTPQIHQPIQPQPQVQYVPQMQPVMVPGGGAASTTVAVTTKGPNHLLHFILTILTAGLWLPVWILIAIFGRRGTTVATSSAAGGGGGVVMMQVPQQQYPPAPTYQQNHPQAAPPPPPPSGF